MIDARIAVGLPAHPKTKKLIRRIGNDGAGWKLVCLFLWAASNRPDGDLSGMTDEDIELAIDWTGKPGEFVEALIDVGFLDHESGWYSIHDWEEHNPWAAGSGLREAKARWNAIKRHHGEVEANKKVPEWAEIRASSIAGSTDIAHTQQASSNAPSPSPSPSPSPKQEEPILSGEPDLVHSLSKANGKTADAKVVLEFLNAKAGRRYKPVKANIDMIANRLKDGATVQECKQVIAKKCREWSTDEKMSEYLRPATLFNRTKFAQYQGELGVEND